MRNQLIILFAICSFITLRAQSIDAAWMPIPRGNIEREPCVIGFEQEKAEARCGATRSTEAHAIGQLSSFGSPEILVCLAEYSDVKFSCAKDDFASHEAMIEAVRDSFDVFFNGEGITVGSNTHSVAAFFREMSFGKFAPHFKLISGITVEHDQAYYSFRNGKERRVEFRNEALSQLSDLIRDDVSTIYDLNQDGVVDGVIIIYPGYGHNIVSDSTSMHPCCWMKEFESSGVKYATQLILPELFNNQSNETNHYGIAVHEISHMLGLPDFYDLNNINAGMDYWSLMDEGEFWKKGCDPTPYTAFERYYLGWLDLEELSEPVTVEGMKSVGEGGKAYVIYNQANRNEYYILENLSASYPWSRSLCQSLGSGLIIYHVDYDYAEWWNSGVNTDIMRQRMTIIPANGHFERNNNFISNGDPDGKARYASELKGHLFPLKHKDESIVKYYGLTQGNNELTDTQRSEEVIAPAIDRVAPAAVLYNANTDGAMLMHKPLTEITYDNTNFTCGFKFMGGSESMGITQIAEEASQTKNAPAYNLFGQRVRSGSRKISIINSKLSITNE